MTSNIGIVKELSCFCLSNVMDRVFFFAWMMTLGSFFFWCLVFTILWLHYVICHLLGLKYRHLPVKTTKDFFFFWDVNH